MSKAVLNVSRILLLGLCIALLLTNTLILAPEVEAASDTNKTETDLTLTEDIPSAEEDVLTQRAITMDEAKKEAQAAVSEQLAIIASAEETQQDVIETQTESVEVPYAAETAYEDSAESSSTTDSDTDALTAAEETQAEESEQTEVTEETQAEQSDVTEQSDAAQSEVVSTGYGFLMDIDNPDPSYVGYAISLSDSDRDMAERIIMGEAGSTGFTGMALVAQCLRDTYVAGGYSSVADVIRQNGYYGSMSITPDQTCKDVVSYIFDQGGSAVQHSIRVFYASNYCTSSWHEAQQFVCSYGYVRYFDL